MVVVLVVLSVSVAVAGIVVAFVAVADAFPPLSLLLTL